MKLNKQLIPFYISVVIALITVLLISAYPLSLFPKIKKLDSQLAQEIQAIKSRGEPVSLEEFKSVPVPDNENAVLVYNKAIDLMFQPDKENRFEYYQEKNALDRISRTYILQTPSKDPEDIEKASSLLSRNKESLELVYKAALLDKYSFNFDYSKNYEVYAKAKVGEIWALTKLLDGEAVLRMIDNQPKSALNSVYASIRMLRLLEEPPGTITTLIRNAVCSIILNRIEKIISETRLDKQDIEKLLKELDFNVINSSIKGIQAGRCLIIECPRCIEIDMLKSLLKMNPSLLERLNLRLAIAWHKSLYGYLNWKKETLYCIKLHTRFINIAALPPCQTKGIWPEEPELFCWRWFVSSSSARIIYINTYRIQAIQDITRLALLLETHKIQTGQYPDSLSLLPQGGMSESLKTLPEDPFSGNDFIYRKDGNGFIIYSVGPNFNDDGGICDSEAHDDIVLRRHLQ